jgi:ribosomal protein L7Ae-like RNA K-turn-binding protein
MDDVLKILGMAYRAKKVVLGEEVLNRIRKVRIMFLASDLSDKSRERFEKKCYFYEIDHIDRYDCEELSKSIGRNNVKVIGITDQGFADSIRSKLQV